MAGWAWPEMSPWRRRGLTIPPKSLKAWFELALWECWMGLLIYSAMRIGTHLVGAASQSIVTIYDFSRCYATGPIAQPCERVAYQTGALNAAFTVWCGVLLVTVGVWMLWELWNAAEPKPITDDFLKLLDDSFGRDWHRPRTWPWARLAWAYGFALIGAACLGPLAALVLSSSAFVRPPVPHVETSQQFRSPR